MKISKRADQQNVELNKDMYTKYDFMRMLENHEIFHIDEEKFEPSYESKFYDEDFRIFLEDMKEIKVICHEGYYMNVAVSNTGKQYFINL